MLDVVIGSLNVGIGLLETVMGVRGAVSGILDVVKVTAPRRVSICTVSKVT